MLFRVYGQHQTSHIKLYPVHSYDIPTKLLGTIENGSKIGYVQGIRSPGRALSSLALPPRVAPGHQGLRGPGLEGVSLQNPWMNLEKK